MDDMNCWEYKKCGREPGGEKEAELGVCLAVTDTRLDGLHGGKNAGRACWALAGTLCGGEVQGTYATKEENCLKCDFYKDVYKSEGNGFNGVLSIFEKLRKSK